MLVKKYLICLFGKCGGDFGEVCLGQMVRFIDNVIFRKFVGVFQGLLKSQFGYYFLEVYFCD